jgi:hypothetical protein
VTERVARACASRPWRVLGGWVLAVVVSVVLIASFLGEALTNTAEVTTPTDSKRGQELLAERLGSGAAPTEVVVVRSQTLTADDPAFQDQLQRLRQAALATGVLEAAAVAAVGGGGLGGLAGPPCCPDAAAAARRRRRAAGRAGPSYRRAGRLRCGARWGGHRGQGL